MKRRMYIFTDAFPWGKGEKTFIQPEIEVLRKHFDITIVSIASKRDRLDETSKTLLPDDIETIHWNRPSLLVFLLHALGFPFSKIARQETRRLLNDGFSIRRLLDSIRSYGISHALLSFYRKAGLFSDSDAIYYSFWFSHQLLALAFRKSDHDIALISRIHGYDLFNERNENGRQPFQWFKKEMVDLLIFASSNAMNAFIGEFGHAASDNRFIVNRLGVSKHPSQSKPAREGKALLVSCSNVIPLKRVGLIAKAIAASPHRDDIEWVHFGDGSLLDEMRSLAQTLRIDATFYGHTPNEEILNFYKRRSVDALILLSETEGGCPVCFQEALSFGIPLIGTNVGGVPEEIDGNGVLLDRNASVEKISEAIDSVCFAPGPEKTRMRERSLELWRTRFDTNKNKIKLIEEFDKKGYIRPHPLASERHVEAL